MTDELTPPEDDAALAAEYALGLLTASEAAAFEQRLAVDPGFRALYARWAGHLTAMFDNTDPVAPPPRVLTALQTRLFPEVRRRFLGGLGVVPALFGAALAGIVVLAVVNFDRLTPLWSQQGPVLLAELASEDGSLVVRAAFDAASGTLTLDRTTGSVAQGRAQELWLFPPGETEAVSLGVLSDAAITTLTPAPALAAVMAGGTLAISDEPPGGSPTGVRTGDVLAIGVVTDV